MHKIVAGVRGALVCAALLLAAAASADAVYRWVDKDGQVHFGDLPPGSAHASPVIPHAQAVEVPPPNSGTVTAHAAQQADECKRKKDQLSVYSAASTISTTDPVGNVRQYTPEEKDKLVGQLQKFVDDKCGGSGSAAAAPATAQQ
jgi:hypothetical protein